MKDQQDSHVFPDPDLTVEEFVLDGTECNGKTCYALESSDHYFHSKIVQTPKNTPAPNSEVSCACPKIDENGIRSAAWRRFNTKEKIDKTARMLPLVV